MSEPAAGRIERWAAHPLGPALLFLFAVLEACLFPAPTEALFLALAIGRPGRSWRLAALATAGAVLGAAAGYAMGAVFFERLGRPVLAWHGLLPRFEQLGAAYDRHLFLALATSGYTPIPFMLYTIAGGAFSVPLLPFLTGAAVGRALKYAVLGALTRYLGPRLRGLLERHLRLAAVVLLLAFLAFLAFRT